MKSRGNPLFRKIIVPWYDADLVCYAVIVFSLVTLAFSVCGVLAAQEVEEKSGVVWVPLLLAGLSLFLAASTLFRLVRRSMRLDSG